MGENVIKRIAHFMIGLFASMLTIMALAPSAFAHAGLTGVEPADGSHVTQGPAQVVLSFSEVLKEPGFASVTRDGELDDSWSYALAEEKLVVTAPSGAEILPGEYVVAYRVVSADGHPIKGSTTFTVDSPESSTNATPSPIVSATVPATETPSVSDDEAGPPGGFASFLKSPWVWGSLILIVAIVSAALMRSKFATGNDDADS